MTYTDQYYVTYRARSASYALNGFDVTSGLTFQYLGDQGFGLAPLHRITTRGPMQDGDSDIDFRLDPRVLQVPLIVQNTNTSQPRFQSYVIRRNLLSIFRPQDSGILSVESIGTSLLSRSINVQVLGGLTFDVDPSEFHVRTVVQFRADDPTWYDEVSTPFLSIPNTQFGVVQATTYAGQWQAFPTILVTGPVTNFTLTNAARAQTLNVPGTIAAGTTYYFDLRYGYKTVYTGPNQTGSNVIANLNPASNLATWSLVPGVNNITASGTGITAATNVYLSWQNRYAGV